MKKGLIGTSFEYNPESGLYGIADIVESKPNCDGSHEAIVSVIDAAGNARSVVKTTFPKDLYDHPLRFSKHDKSFAFLDPKSSALVPIIEDRDR